MYQVAVRSKLGRLHSLIITSSKEVAEETKRRHDAEEAATYCFPSEAEIFEIADGEDVTQCRASFARPL